jgi:hypothetical protein
LPLIAFQFPKAFGPDFPPETLARLATIPEIIGLKEASFDTTKTVETIATARGPAAQARHHDRQRHVHLRGDGDGLRRRADRLRRTATRELIDDASAVARRTSLRVRDLGQACGPLARSLARADPRLPAADEGSAEDAGPHCARDGARAAARCRRRERAELPHV